MIVGSAGDVAPVPQTPQSPTALSTPPPPVTTQPPVRSLIDALEWFSTSHSAVVAHRRSIDGEHPALTWSSRSSWPSDPSWW